MKASTAALDRQRRRERAEAAADALPPLTDAQVERIATLLTLGRTPEPTR